MLKHCLVIILCMAALLSRAQDIQSILKLDKIINLPLAGNESLAANVGGDYFWVYLPTWEETDTISFLRIHLETGTSDTVKSIIPGITFKISQPNANALAVNNKHLTLSFTHQLLILDFSNGHLVYNRFVPINQLVKNLWLSGDKLIIGFCYNVHPKSQPNKTFIGIYDIEGDRISNYIQPKFDNIEFSHFGPNNWISASNHGKIAFSQTTTYNISIYNSKLDSITQISHYPKDWLSFEYGYMDSIRQIYNEANPKGVINALILQEDKISRIESIEWFNDSLLFVRVIPRDNKKQNRIRYYDVWEINNSTPTLKHEKLIDQKHQGDTITLSNFPLLAVYSTLYMSDPYVLALRTGSNINPIGLTYEQLKAKEEVFYEQNVPIWSLYLYKLNP